MLLFTLSVILSVFGHVSEASPASFSGSHATGRDSLGVTEQETDYPLLSKRHRTLPRLSPPFPKMFQVQLPIPPLKQPMRKVRVLNPSSFASPLEPAPITPGPVRPLSHTDPESGLASNMTLSGMHLNITESDSNPEMNVTATVIRLNETVDGSAPVLDTSNFTIDWTATEAEMSTILAKLNNMAAKYLSLTREIWYYEMEIKQFNQSIYSSLSNTTMVGYDGVSPGPTIIVPKGTESIVRFVNNSPAKNSVHLHGSFSRAPFDGWAEDTTDPGQYKDYYFPNQQNSRTIWYHDHALGITAENAYMGQAGMYIIHDPAEDALNLPSGYGIYDIPMVLSSKQYNADGSLFSTVGEKISLWGDVIHVNGQPWPVLNVQPRKYRFRFLNAAVSRTFSLHMVNLAAENRMIPFQVIASDSGLLEKPDLATNLYISMAERYEIVFDFTNHTSQTLELRNFRKAGGAGVEEEYEHSDKVMRFVVARRRITPDTSTVPALLREMPWPNATTVPGFPGRHGKKVDHRFKFHRQNGQWLINGVGFAEVENRVLAKVPRGTVEIWELENTTDGWSHPIHVHLVDFRILHRSGTHFFDSAPRSVQGYERNGLKDVVWLGKEEKVWVEARYAPWDGVYMFHCHNLIHEDDDMMGAFNVTGLIKSGNLGYKDEDFIDPMEGRFRAKGYRMEDFRGRRGVFSNVGIDLAVWEMALRDPYLFGRLGGLGGA